MSDTNFDPEAALAAKGILLPPAAKPLGNYLTWSSYGTWIATSGQLPWVDGKLGFHGKIGSDLTPEQGYQAARVAALNALAQVRDALGSLSRVSQIIRVEGTFQVAPGFLGFPEALNGASDVIDLAFGERGRHCRMVYTNTEMPMNTPVMIVIHAGMA